MSLVVLVSEHDHQTYATPRRVRMRDRLTAHLRSFKLDQALADGVPPDSTPALALRAQHLLTPAARQRLANQIQRTLRDKRPNRRGSRSGVPNPRQALRDLAPDLQTLAERLLDQQPVAVRGVAAARILLCDGCGPLYRADPSQAHDAISATTTGLDTYA